jgi:hypothetical protein
MKNIDFLPSRYREGYAQRTAVVRRWTIVIGLAVIITPLAIFQYVVHANVVHSFVLVEPEYMVAQAKSKRVAELEQQLEQARGEAGLLAWLAHPWPRSQLLAQINAPLPDSIRLSSIRLTTEPKPVTDNGATSGRNRAARRNVDERESALLESRPAHEKEIVRLTEHVAQNDSVVTLSGLTVNNTELHTYVARLRLAGMFVKSELRSLESMPGQEKSKAQVFEIRLVLSPGHALPPKAEASKSSPAVASASTPKLATKP